MTGIPYWINDCPACSRCRDCRAYLCLTDTPEALCDTCNTTRCDGCNCDCTQDGAA